MNIFRSIKAKVAAGIAAVGAFIASTVSTVSATIDTTNITDAINLIGTVGGAFINALKTIFVDNLGTILTLVAVGIVIMVFTGFGQVIVRFAFGLLGSMEQKMAEKYHKK